MAVKTILVCPTSETGADALMRAACILARRHDAHLIGLHIVEPLMLYPGIAMYMPETVHAAYGDAPHLPHVCGTVGHGAIRIGQMAGSSVA